MHSFESRAQPSDLDGQRSMGLRPSEILNFSSILASYYTKVCCSGELYNTTHSNFSSEGAFQQAETHFLAAGNRDSARSFAKMMAAWLPVGGDPGAFAARGVIPYVFLQSITRNNTFSRLDRLLSFLLLQNILAARTFLETFISQVRRKNPTLIVSPTAITIPSSSSTSTKTEDELFVTADPTINFLQLAIRACQRGSGDTAENQRDARNAWLRIVQQYRHHGRSVLTEPAMTQVRSSAEAVEAEYRVVYRTCSGRPIRF